MATKESFPVNLAYYMKQARMNQAELAKAVGKTEGAVSHWLAGHAFPRIDTVQRIATLFGCDTKDLLEERPLVDGSRMMKFVSMSHPLNLDDLPALNRQPATPKEDMQMTNLWRTASLQAKRAAIAVLESMKEENIK